MLRVIRWPVLVSLFVLVLLAVPCAFGEETQASEFAEQRRWIEEQPQTFNNAVLFRIENGEVHRSDRFPMAGVILGDYDGDGDVDRYDYVAMQICLSFSGPGVTIPPACNIFDADGDADNDLADFAAFTIAFTGPLGGVLVEAGGLVPVPASADGYYSGEPGTDGQNALNGIARQAGYDQDDLWYEWTVLSQPVGSGEIIMSNSSRPATAYTILGPFLPGDYVFNLLVTNLVTLEFADDSVTLAVFGCVADADCAPCEICDIASAECVYPGPFEFTLSTDNLLGTTCDDTFEAPLVFNPGTGTQVASLQTGDGANGLAGNDTFNARFSPFGASVSAFISNIETINLTNSGPGSSTLLAGNISGVDRINSVSSGDDVIVSNLQELTDFGMSGINGASVDLSLSFGLASTTSGSADSITGTLTGVNAGAVNILTTTINGFETLNLVSEGSANSLNAITQTTGFTMAMCNISGSQNLTLNTMPNTVLTYNASTGPGGLFTGALQLGGGTSASNYFSFATTNLNNITGGSGDDTFVFGNTLNANDFDAPGEALNGGAGTDVFQATFGASVNTALRLLNIEELRWNATTNGVVVNLTGVAGLTMATIEADGVANNGFTLLNISGAPLPALELRGNGLQSAQTLDGVNYQAAGVAGSSDALLISINNRGTPLNTSGSSNTFTVGTITADNIELFTVNANDGPVGAFGLEASGMSSFTMSAAATGAGNSNVTITSLMTSGGADTITTINTNGVTGNFSATCNDVASGAIITLGGGDDLFSLGASTGANITVGAGGGADIITGTGQADIINGEAGNDTLTGLAGNDIINGGPDSDTIVGGSGNNTITGGTGSDVIIHDQNAPNNRSDVTDFTSGSGGDTMRFDISTLGLAGGDEYVGLVGGLAQNSSEEIAILTGVAYANDEAAETAVAARVTTDGLDMVIIYFNATDVSTHVIYDQDAGVNGAGAPALLGRLLNITTQAVHDTMTFANIDSQP